MILLGNQSNLLRQKTNQYPGTPELGGGGAGGAAAPLAFCWEGQGGQKCPLSM